MFLTRLLKYRRVVTKIFGFVETLKRNKQSLLGAPVYRASAPAARTSPNNAIASEG
jgi:hypothetical protein